MSSNSDHGQNLEMVGIDEMFDEIARRCRCAVLVIERDEGNNRSHVKAFAPNTASDLHVQGLLYNACENFLTGKQGLFCGDDAKPADPNTEAPS